MTQTKWNETEWQQNSISLSYNVIEEVKSKRWVPLKFRCRGWIMKRSKGMEDIFPLKRSQASSLDAAIPSPMNQYWQTRMNTSAPSTPTSLRKFPPHFSPLHFRLARPYLHVHFSGIFFLPEHFVGAFSEGHYTHSMRCSQWLHEQHCIAESNSSAAECV